MDRLQRQIRQRVLHAIGGPSVSDQWFTKLGQQIDLEVMCTKDGAVFDGDQVVLLTFG